MVKILGSKGSKRRRTGLALATAAALVFLAIPATSFADRGAPNYCDFGTVSKSGAITEQCAPPLTDASGNNNTFESGDGNLLLNPSGLYAGTNDWSTVGIVCPTSAGAGTGCGADPLTGSTDNSFGQGTKEDDPNVTVVSGSIPPNKSDLTRFYLYSETIGTGPTAQTYLSLAWERTNVLGSANMDFEINALPQPNLLTPGPKTLNRSPGDLLVTYDFTNGGSKPTLGLNRWLVSATSPTPPPPLAANVCLSSNSFPCWGDHVTLSSAVSEGATNSLDAVTDPITGFNRCAGPPAGSCAAFTFGEANINLTGAGVFSANKCTTFSSAFLKSRSSASFPAEVKDFVAPIPTVISNCATVTVIKHTVPPEANQDFTYSWNVTGTQTPDLASSACPTGANAFTLNASGTDTENCYNVLVGGSYSVTEGGPPPGWDFTSVVDGGSTGGASCTQSGSTATANISVPVADSHAVCLYTNTQQLGALKVTKQSTKGNAPLAGATFSVTGPGGFSTTLTSGADGTACVDQLAFGTYTVTETGAPQGYQINNPSPVSVSVDHNATCTSGTPNAPPAPFTDTPLSLIRVLFHSKAGVGVTTATIQCTGEGSASNLPDDSTGHLLDNLVPGTYQCQVVIDP